MWHTRRKKGMNEYELSVEIEMLEDNTLNICIQIRNVTCNDRLCLHKRSFSLGPHFAIIRASCVMCNTRKCCIGVDQAS